MNSAILLGVATVVVALFLALLSPGPVSILIVKSGIKNRILDALGLSLGIVLCIVWLGNILTYSVLPHRVLKSLGEIFLLCLVIKALKTRKMDFQTKCNMSTSQPC